MSVAATPALRAVREVMGMPVTIDWRDGAADRTALDEAYRELAAMDALFSPFRHDSEVSRINRGDLLTRAANPLVRDVLGLCDLYGLATGGCFSAWPDGRLDPCGLVKAWAVDRACAILERQGARDYLVDAGGDVVARGRPAAGARWRIGIRHPVERDRVARVVIASDLCVATSGTYERGPHIVDPRSGRAAAELTSLTVVGPDIVEADAWATAAFVMGADGLDFVESRPGYEAYAIFPDLRARWTSGFDRLCDPTF
jgi:thiamine biosynthesis lipoprotein